MYRITKIKINIKLNYFKMILRIKKKTIFFTLKLLMRYSITLCFVNITFNLKFKKKIQNLFKFFLKTPI